MSQDDDKLKEFALKQEGNINDDILDNSDLHLKQDTAPIAQTNNAPQHGYGRIDKNIMPYKGRHYPESMQFEIRPASTPEIKHWSTIDDNANPSLIYSYFTDIIEKCVRVIGGSTNDIKESDRLWFVLYIHELSFIETERPAILKAKCKNSICKHEFNAKLSKDAIQFVEPTIDTKYINPETGAYDVQTKSYGVITINRPSIKVGNAIIQYINDNDQKWVQDNAVFLDMLTYLVLPNITPTNKLLTSIYGQYKMWSPKQTSFMLDLIARCKLIPKQQFIIKCPKCGTETAQDFDLEGGIRSILLPVSNIDDELL